MENRAEQSIVAVQSMRGLPLTITCVDTHYYGNDIDPTLTDINGLIAYEGDTRIPVGKCGFSRRATGMPVEQPSGHEVRQVDTHACNSGAQFCRIYSRMMLAEVHISIAPVLAPNKAAILAQSIVGDHFITVPHFIMRRMITKETYCARHYKNIIEPHKDWSEHMSVTLNLVCDAYDFGDKREWIIAPAHVCFYLAIAAGHTHIGEDEAEACLGEGSPTMRFLRANISGSLYKKMRSRQIDIDALPEMPSFCSQLTVAIHRAREIMDRVFARLVPTNIAKDRPLPDPIAREWRDSVIALRAFEASQAASESERDSERDSDGESDDSDASGDDDTSGASDSEGSGASDSDHDDDEDEDFVAPDDEPVQPKVANAMRYVQVDSDSDSDQEPEAKESEAEESEAEAEAEVEESEAEAEESDDDFIVPDDEPIPVYSASDYEEPRAKRARSEEPRAKRARPAVESDDSEPRKKSRNVTLDREHFELRRARCVSKRQRAYHSSREDMPIRKRLRRLTRTSDSDDDTD